MSRLSVALRNYLVQAPEVQALVAAGTLGKGPHWTDGWIFPDKPFANIEKYSAKALVVVTQTTNYDPMNVYNTEEFPRVYLDVWASPTRDAAGSPVQMNADNVCETVFAAIKPYVHTVHLGVHTTSPAFMGTPGNFLQWGTAAEIASNTGLFIGSSTYTNGPVFTDVSDGNGAVMARYTLGVQVIG